MKLIRRLTPEFTIQMLEEMAREYVAVEIYWLRNAYFVCILRTIPDNQNPAGNIRSEGKGATAEIAIKACYDAWKESEK